MGKKRFAVGFATGLANGITNGLRQQKLDEERAEDRRMRSEEHAARMEETNRIKSDRVALSEAARPTTIDVGANGAIRLDSADNRDVDGTSATVDNTGGYRTAGKTFADPTSASAAMTTYNAKDATIDRTAQAYRATGRPGEAISLENANWQQGRARTVAGREDDSYARRLKEEGVVDAWRALQSGNAAGMVEAFNKSGQYKIQPENVVITPEERDVPGIGRVKTHTAKVNIVNPDGSITARSFNSHDLGNMLMPYKDQLELLHKGTKEASEGKVREAHARAYDASAAAANARASGGGGGGKSPYARLDEDDKIHYNSVNTAVRDAEKALSTAMTGLQQGDNPDTHPGVLFAKRQVQQAKQNQFKVGVKLGVITPEDLVSDILGAAKTKEEALVSLKQLHGTVGEKVADRVAALLAEQDQWKALVRGDAARNPQTPTAKAIASAPPGTVTLQPSGGWSAGGAGAPAAAAPAAAPVALASQQFVPDQAMEQRVLAEETEMGQGKRMKYSPEVQVYAMAKDQAERARRDEENAKAAAARDAQGRAAALASRRTLPAGMN